MDVLHAGPAGAGELAEQLRQAVETISGWMAGYGDFAPHPSLDVPLEQLERATGALHERLRENYPFFHPRYVGQMLKPPHPAAVIGYVSAMLINPNNHALDGGPATARMEKEVVAQLAAMFGFPEHLGHLTSSGTIANLEALFVAREIHPGKAVAHSADAHYTHGRMCHVLGVEAVAVPTAADGTMDLQALEETLRGGRIGTVVATPGTTGLGAVDPVHEIVALVPPLRRPGARGRRLRRVLPPHRRRQRRRGGGRAVRARSPSATRSSSTRTSTACSPTAAARCSSATPAWPGTTCTTRPTPTSPPMSCTSARSPWNAPGPARPPPRCGSPCSCCPLTPDGPGRGAAPRAARGPGLGRPHRRERRAHPVPAPAPGHPQLLPRPAAPVARSTTPARTSSTPACACPPRSHCSSPPTPWTAPAWPPAGTRWTADVASGRILRSVLMKPETEQHVPVLHQQVLDLLPG